MKRTFFVLALLITTPLLAFDAAHPSVRTIGVVSSPLGGGWSADESFARSVVARLTGELRERGFAAASTGTTLEDESRKQTTTYDILVEISSATFDNEDLGGVAIGGRDGAADIGIVRSHATAVVRVYDGVTLEEIDASSLERHATGVAPTAIGVGDRHFGLWISLPVARYTRQRSLAHGLAEEAAARIVAVLRPEAQ